MKNYSRSERVSGLLRREIPPVLNETMEWTGIGMVSVTDVEVNRDISLAKVYVGILNIERAGETIRELNEHAGEIRSELSGKLHMRSVPALKFFHDTSGETGRRIEQLLDGTRKPDN